MGQTLPPKTRLLLSCETLLKGMLEASIGPYACDRIIVGRMAHNFMLTMLAEHSSPCLKRDTWRCAFCRSQCVTSTGRCLNCGAPRTEEKVKHSQVLKFMGAEVLRHEIPDNEVRFINSRCPDYSGRLLLEM